MAVDSGYQTVPTQASQKVRVVPQDQGASSQPIGGQQNKFGHIQNYDGFNGNVQETRDNGLLGWMQQRQFDPDAYNVTDLDKRVGQNQTQAQNYATRAGPRANQSPSNEWRGQQTSLADMLTAQANGTAPSLAQAQLQRGTDANIASQMAMAAAQRGPNQAGALRSLAYQGAAARQQQAADSGALRLQEQQQAQGQLATLLSGARGQDMQLAQGDQSAQVQTMGLNDAQNRYYAQSANDLYTQQMQARQAREQLGVQYDLGLRGVAVNGPQQATQAGGALASAIGTGIGIASKVAL